MMRRILLPALILLAVWAFAATSTSAASSAATLSASGKPAPVPGNYCISCHLAGDPHLAGVTAWRGSIGREVNSPCPAATKIHEELYYTERMLLMIDRAKAQVSTLPDKQQVQLDKYTQQYSRLLDEPVASLDSFTAGAQTTRYRLNKIYSGLNQIAEANKTRTVLIYAGIATLIVLGSLLWGLYNTRSIARPSPKKSSGRLKPAVFVLAILAFFMLPLFRIPAAVATTTTAAQQQAQAVLDTADRAAGAADRAQARAWMLARLGAAWNGTDPARTRAALNEALTSVERARANEEALWGQSLAVQEAMIGIPIDMQNAELIAVDVNAARAREWSVPLIAIEWNQIDPGQAIAVLRVEQNILNAQTGLYRDLQLRLVALAWAEVDPSEAEPAAGIIDDASIRAWTLREIAVLTDNETIFDQAAEAARRVADPVQRARSLREIAVASGNRSLFAEAISALDGITGASLAYALSDLSIASGEHALVERIDEVYPDARAAASLGLGEYQRAWDAAAGITDPYEQARAQSAIAAAWKNAAAAQEIAVPLYRDLALRDVIRETGNATLTDSIHSAYYQVQALTALGDFEQAAALADGIGDAYPLVELASALAQEDSQTALALVGKMNREADKAVVLNRIAAVTDQPDLFEQAQGMALAARVQGDVLAPSEASLELANLLWQVDLENAQSALQQAYEAALRISIK